MELTEVQKEADSAGRKAIFFGLGALFLAGVFGWMLAHLTSTGPETQPVVVAAADIPALTQLKIEQLKVVEWPTQSLPKGTFQKPEDVVHTGEINISGILANEPLLAERLSTPDRGLGMSQMVEPNMRAYVVRVDDQVATSEIMHPGANVDVVVTLDDPKYREPVTKVVLQNVQILAVGDSIDVERTAPRTTDDSASNSQATLERHRVVTLAVAIGDVETLTFAARSGKLDLILRNNNDAGVVTTKGVTFDKLLGRNRDGSPLAKSPSGGDAAAAAAGAPSGYPAPPAAPTGQGEDAPPQHRSHGHSRDQGPSIIKVHR